MKRLAYEFFAGGGMARLGLGPDWRIGVANDIDPAKCAAYRANFGGADLIERDIHALTPDDLPGHADLAWASFPCQDLSLAGTRGGLTARRSAAFWGFWTLIEALTAEGRAPRMLVVENVAGFASSRGGQDLALALSALAAGGYHYDVRIIDAAAFLPQSRPRLFILAWHAASIAPPFDVRPAPDDALARALAGLTEDAGKALRPLPFAPMKAAPPSLSSIIDTDAPFFPPEKTAHLLNMMAPLHRERLEAARAEAARRGIPLWGTFFRRTRGGIQRAEIRFDRAGCLRTPAGGSSRQGILCLSPRGAIDARLMTGREAARLMGLPEAYRLPGRATQALRLAGDGVAVPVVRYIAEAVLAPLLSASLEPAAAAE